jgi:hypothetical protein
MHHEIGYGPAVNAFTCIKWVWIWLALTGIPCALAMYFPAWPKGDDSEAHH